MKHSSKCKHLFYRSVPQALALILLTALVLLAVAQPLSAAQIFQENPASGGNSLVGQNDTGAGQ